MALEKTLGEPLPVTNEEGESSKTFYATTLSYGNIVVILEIFPG